MSAEQLLAQEFGAFPDLIRAHARERPEHPALIEGDAILTYRELAALMDRIAFALQRDGVGAGEAVAICARASIPYAAVFCGALTAGAAVAPLAPSSTAASLAMMIADCATKVLFLDRETGEALEGVRDAGRATPVALDDSAAGEPLLTWLGPEGAKPAPVEIRPD
jgi:acyl-CoA synthetase (AMP-forming)/AMP-acid ligase II